MKYKKSSKIIAAVAITTLVLLSGCGSSSSNSEEMLNTSKSTNELGYYGPDVIFGGEHIVGTWRVEYVSSESNDSREYEFYDDGTMFDPMDFSDTNLNLKNYGVSEDGKTLIVDNIQYVILSMTNCYDINASQVDNGEWVGLYEFCKLSD